MSGRGVRGRPRGRGRRGGGVSLAPRDLRVKPPSAPECFATRGGDVLDRLEKKDTLRVFLLPVDNEIAPEYDTIVEKGMDFTTVRDKLKAGEYRRDIDLFHADLSLIWSNCLLYNGTEPDNVFSKKAMELRKLADTKLIPAMAENLDGDRRHLEAWMDRHRRKPQASPTGSYREDGALPDGLSLGDSVAGGGFAGGGEVGVVAGGAVGGADPDVPDAAAIELEAAARARALRSEHDTAAAVAAANRQAAVSARKIALREQYGVGGSGLWEGEELEEGEKERAYYLGDNRPPFLPSSVRYRPEAYNPGFADDGLGGSGRGNVSNYHREREMALLALQRGEGDRIRPVHQIDAHARIFRSQSAGTGDEVYQIFGVAAQKNPCRPLGGVEKVKVKDYVQSLQAFVDGAGVVATKIISELLSPEMVVLKEEQDRLKKRALEEAGNNGKMEGNGREEHGGQGSADDPEGRPEKVPALGSQSASHPQSFSQISKLLPKLNKRIDELDGVDGLERIVGADLANEVRAVPLSEIEFAMPYGLSPQEMKDLAKFAGGPPSTRTSRPDLSFLVQLERDTDSHALRQGASGSNQSHQQAAAQHAHVAQARAQAAANAQAQADAAARAQADATARVQAEATARAQADAAARAQADAAARAQAAANAQAQAAAAARAQADALARAEADAHARAEADAAAQARTDTAAQAQTDSAAQFAQKQQYAQAAHTQAVHAQRHGLLKIHPTQRNEEPNRQQIYQHQNHRQEPHQNLPHIQQPQEWAQGIAQSQGGGLGHVGSLPDTSRLGASLSPHADPEGGILDGSQNGSTSHSLLLGQSRSPHDPASIAEEAKASALREKELEAATRRQHMSNGKLYAQSVNAAERMAGATPTGAMHDAALLGAPMTPLMAGRLSGLQNEHNLRAEKAAGLASEMATQTATASGHYNVGLPVGEGGIGSILRGMIPEQRGVVGSGTGEAAGNGTVGGAAEGSGTDGVAISGAGGAAGSGSGGVTGSGTAGAASKAGTGSKAGLGSTSSVGSGGGRNSGGGRIPSPPSLPAPDENSCCAHCGTKDTPGWRAGPGIEERLCNACGLYYMKKQMMRPQSLFRRRSSPSARRRKKDVGVNPVGVNPVAAKPAVRGISPSDGTSSVMSNGSRPRASSPSASASNSSGGVAVDRPPAAASQPSPFPMEDTTLGVSAVLASSAGANAPSHTANMNNFAGGNVTAAPIPPVSEFFMPKGQALEQQPPFALNGTPNNRGGGNCDEIGGSGNPSAAVFPPMLSGMEFGGDSGGLMPGMGEEKLPSSAQPHLPPMNPGSMDADATNDVSAPSGQEMLNSLFGGGSDGGTDFAF